MLDEGLGSPIRSRQGLWQVRLPKGRNLSCKGTLGLERRNSIADEANSVLARRWRFVARTVAVSPLARTGQRRIAGDLAQRFHEFAAFEEIGRAHV